MITDYLDNEVSGDNIITIINTKIIRIIFELRVLSDKTHTNISYVVFR